MFFGSGTETCQVTFDVLWFYYYVINADVKFLVLIFSGFRNSAVTMLKHCQIPGFRNINSYKADNSYKTENSYRKIKKPYTVIDRIWKLTVLLIQPDSQIDHGNQTDNNI
jgi:hypothetical protein